MTVPDSALGDLGRVVLGGLADLGVVHVRAVEEVRVGGPRHEGGDGHARVLAVGAGQVRLYLGRHVLQQGRLSNRRSVCGTLTRMAGGMDRRPSRPGHSLAARTAAPLTPTLQRHCWVVDGELPNLRAPGLLVEWRRTTGWEGRVAYVVEVDGEAQLVEA